MTALVLRYPGTPKAARGDALTFEEERVYVSLSSSIVRALRELGLGPKGASACDPTAGFYDALHKIAAEGDKAPTA